MKKYHHITIVNNNEYTKKITVQDKKHNKIIQFMNTIASHSFGIYFSLY